MNRCDEFEVAIEMRHHGALEPAVEAELRAHIEGCASCRAFETLSTNLEKQMTAETIEEARTVDWNVLREGIQHKLGQDVRVRLKAMGLTLLFIFPATLLMKGSRVVESPLMFVGTALAVLGFVYLRGRLRAHQMGGYGHRDLLFYYRLQLERRLRLSRMAPVVGLGATAYFFSRLAAQGSSTLQWVGFAVLTAGIWAAAAFNFFVRRPRIQRELDALRRP